MAQSQGRLWSRYKPYYQQLHQNIQNQESYHVSIDYGNFVGAAKLYYHKKLDETYVEFHINVPAEYETEYYDDYGKCTTADYFYGDCPDPLDDEIPSLGTHFGL